MLKEILTQTPEVLHQKGAEAKRFVMEEKNNCVQAKKVLDMISGQEDAGDDVIDLTDDRLDWNSDGSLSFLKVI